MQRDGRDTSIYLAKIEMTQYRWYVLSEIFKHNKTYIMHEPDTTTQQLLSATRSSLLDTGMCTATACSVALHNDAPYILGSEQENYLAAQLLNTTKAAAIIVAKPACSVDTVIFNHYHDCDDLSPRDSESQSSLHSIPLIRRGNNTLQLITEALKKRKGCLVEGVGIISLSAIAIDQAAIHWSSVYHALSIQAMVSSMQTKHRSDHMDPFWEHHLQPAPTLPASCIDSADNKEALRHILVDVGKKMVAYGLVDSFFGNISQRHGNKLILSKTAARLDQLTDNLVTLDRHTLTPLGMLATSELPAHSAITSLPHVSVLLHGHPRVPVALSLLHPIGPHTIAGIPVVTGEGGVGGLAKNLYQLFHETNHRACIVQGHGLFCISEHGSYDALRTMLAHDSICKDYVRGVI